MNFAVFIAVIIKIVVLSVIILCNLLVDIHVSEKYASSIFRVKNWLKMRTAFFCKILVSARKSTWCHNPYNSNLNFGVRFCKNGILKKIRGFGPLANYTDRASAACWRSSASFCG
jgi:hypothetical protein